MIGIERDRNAIKVAIENSQKLGVELEFRRCDISVLKSIVIDYKKREII